MPVSASITVLVWIGAGGFRQHEDVEILARITNGDAALLARMAADLVERKVDVIMAVSPAAVRAVKEATNTIPIVASCTCRMADRRLLRGTSASAINGLQHYRGRQCHFS